MVTSSYPKFPGDVTAPFIESIAPRCRGARPPRGRRAAPPSRAARGRRTSPCSFLPTAMRRSSAGASGATRRACAATCACARAPFSWRPSWRSPCGRSCAARLRRDALRRRARALGGPQRRPRGATSCAATACRWSISLHGSDVFLAETLLPARVLAPHALRAGRRGDRVQRGPAPARGAPGRAAERTRTVPYGVDAWTAADVDVAAVRARLGVPPEATFVLGLGPPGREEGLRVPDRGRGDTSRGVHVALAGDGDLRRELEAQAQSTRRAGAPGGRPRPRFGGGGPGSGRRSWSSPPSSIGRVTSTDCPTCCSRRWRRGAPSSPRAWRASRTSCTDGVDGLLVPEKDPPRWPRR